VRLRERGVVAGFEFTFGSSDTLLLGRRRRIRRRRRTSTCGPGPEVKKEERKNCFNFFLFPAGYEGEKEKRRTLGWCVWLSCVYVNEGVIIKLVSWFLFNSPSILLTVLGRAPHNPPVLPFFTRFPLFSFPLSYHDSPSSYEE
jgi:hypothetical protein